MVEVRAAPSVRGKSTDLSATKKHAIRLPHAPDAAAPQSTPQMRGIHVTGLVSWIRIFKMSSVVEAPGAKTNVSSAEESSSVYDLPQLLRQIG